MRYWVNGGAEAGFYVGYSIGGVVRCCDVLC